MGQHGIAVQTCRVVEVFPQYAGRRPTRRTHPYVLGGEGYIQPVDSGHSPSEAGFFAWFGSRLRVCGLRLAGQEKGVDLKPRADKNLKFGAGWYWFTIDFNHKTEEKHKNSSKLFHVKHCFASRPNNRTFRHETHCIKTRFRSFVIPGNLYGITMAILRSYFLHSISRVCLSEPESSPFIRRIFPS